MTTHITQETLRAVISALDDNLLIACLGNEVVRLELTRQLHAQGQVPKPTSQMWTPVDTSITPTIIVEIAKQRVTELCKKAVVKATEVQAGATSAPSKHLKMSSDRK